MDISLCEEKVLADPYYRRIANPRPARRPLRHRSCSVHLHAFLKDQSFNFLENNVKIVLGEQCFWRSDRDLILRRKKPVHRHGLGMKLAQEGADHSKQP
jgi:hypothetical protein